MAKKNDYCYFQTFIKATEFSMKAAEILSDTLNNFDPEKLPQTMKEMHAVEQAADNAKHEMNKVLAKAFITPIEREDIMLLAHNLDDATDVIEDVLIRIYMYNVKTLRKQAFEFAEVIGKCCDAMYSMMKEFSNFKKSSKLKEYIIEINRLEEVGDRLYTDSMRELFTTVTDPVELLAWNEIFERLEKCCDKCEHIANTVESVVMKNS